MLAIVQDDAGMIALLIVFAGGSLFFCIQSRLAFVKAGTLICGAAICLGVASSGIRPIVGGNTTTEAYFGCTLMFIGLIGTIVLGAIEEVFRRLKPADSGEHAFPVMMKSDEPSSRE